MAFFSFPLKVKSRVDHTQYEALGPDIQLGTCQQLFLIPLKHAFIIPVGAPHLGYRNAALLSQSHCCLE